MAVPTERKIVQARIVAARLHAANLEQPVQELFSNPQSFIGLAEEAEFPPTVEEKP